MILELFYFRSYEIPPKPSQQQLHIASSQIYQGILSGLKSKSTNPMYIVTDLDIWRYVSHGKCQDSNHKSFKLFTQDDLSRLPLPGQWWWYINIHGEGHAIEPPLKIKPILRQSRNIFTNATSCHRHLSCQLRS